MATQCVDHPHALVRPSPSALLTVTGDAQAEDGARSGARLSNVVRPHGSSHHLTDHIVRKTTGFVADRGALVDGLACSAAARPAHRGPRHDDKTAWPLHRNPRSHLGTPTSPGTWIPWVAFGAI